MKNVSALILAAGFSSRMGRLKPLLDVGGKPALRCVIDTFHNAGIDDIAVVTGFERERLTPLLYDVTEVVNADFAAGMFASVQCGIEHFAAADTVRVLMTPADCPLITVDARLLGGSNGVDDGYIVIPTHKGRHGHPASLPRRIFAEIALYSGDGGLRSLLAAHSELIRYVESDNPGILLDMDTPEEYRTILASAAKQQT